jgi:hypothetical protein
MESNALTTQMQDDLNRVRRDHEASLDELRLQNEEYRQLVQRNQEEKKNSQHDMQLQSQQVTKEMKLLQD